MDFDAEELPSIRRGERFTVEETNVLVREVRARKHRLFQVKGGIEKYQEVRNAWDEIAEIVSTIVGIRRTGEKCRKRYNDIKRRGNQKLASRKKPSKAVETSSPPKLSKEEHHPEFGGVKIGFHDQEEQVGHIAEVKQESDIHGYRKDRKSSTQTAALNRRSVNALQHKDKPYLDLQQLGFNMLEKELQGVREVMASLNTRMNSIQLLLQSIQLISTSLRRIAIAVERLQLDSCLQEEK